VGSQCAGAKVNGVLVPLRHRLANGDTVEIITSPHQRPKQEWLDLVVSGRARSNIRHAIKAEQVEHARKLGREILTRDLSRRSLGYERLLKTGKLKALARELNYRDLDAMLNAIAYGKLDVKHVGRRLAGHDDEAHKPNLLRRVLQIGRPGTVKVDGQANVVVRFAKCCSPVPGDPVQGFITRGRGVTVHTRDCSKIFHLDPERRVPVEWEAAPGGELRRVKVRVVSEDRPGLLAEISNRISAEGMNIDGARISTSINNRAIQEFDLRVKDRKHLEGVLKQISKTRGVLSVERVRP
jgi:GTP pyrophosphokinase